MCEFTTQAALALSNYGGVAIMLSDSGDAVKAKWYDDEPTDWIEIEWTMDEMSEPYFKAFGRRFLISEFIKISI